MDQIKENRQKPLCPLIDANGNIFHLLALAKKSLYESDEDQKITEMIERVYASQSYEEALQVLNEYVEPCDSETYNEHRQSIRQMFQ